MILGTKFEHNSYTGAETQPSLKFLYQPDKERTYWASVARAVRTPSRTERDGIFNILALPPSFSGGVPNCNPNRRPLNCPGSLLNRTSPSPNFGSEHLTAWELGYRFHPSRKWSADLSTFYFHYDQLRHPVTTVAAGTLNPILANLSFTNQGFGYSHGAELSLYWQASEDLILQPGLSHINVDWRNPDGSPSRQDSPSYIFNLAIQKKYSRNRRLDLHFRCVSGFTARGLVGDVPSSPVEIPGYEQIDARFSWKLTNGWKISLEGRNLLKKQQQENYSIVQSYGYDTSLTERSFALRVSRHF